MGKENLRISNQSTHIHGMVHVKRQERQALWAFLLNEGVISVKQENVGKHDQTKIDNLKVMCVMQSLKSRGFAKKVFTWQHRYYTITDSGCAHIRSQLGITKENVVPKTHQVRQPTEQQQGGERGGDRRQMTRGRGGFGRGRGGFGEGRGPRNFNRDGAPQKEFAKPQGDAEASNNAPQDL